MKTEWDLSPLEKGKSFEEKREDLKESANRFIQKWKDNKDYLQNPKVLKEALDEYERWVGTMGAGGDESIYFALKSCQDQENPEIKAKVNKIDEFSQRIVNEIRFFEINISKIPKEKQEEFLESKELIDYVNFLKRLFETSKYVLSEKEEKIMSLKEKTSYWLWVDMVSEFISKEQREVLDEDGERKVKTFEELINMIKSQNKEVRDEAGKAINEILEKHSASAEAEINAILLNKKNNDEIRGYERPDKAKHVEDDVRSEMVDLLIATVGKRFEISHKYYELKAKLLKVPKLEYHERVVDYGKVDKKYPYEDAVKIISKVFSDLDGSFLEDFEMFLEKGLIDVYPRKGKVGGGFCAHFMKSRPSFILLNHTGKFRDVQTLAHEMGHAINNEFVKENQNSLYFDNSSATAEVASIFMEDFVFQELVKEADDELKLSLLMSKLDGEISSIMRQTACYNFEKELHKEFREKGYLSKEGVGKIFSKHMGSYLGEFVNLSKGSENWWIYWSHIRNFFYVYSYVSGLLISKSLQRKVKEDKKFIEKVKVFLSKGTSKSPEDIFKEMGIELNEEFWNVGLDEFEDLLTETETLAKRLGKI